VPRSADSSSVNDVSFSSAQRHVSIVAILKIKIKPAKPSSRLRSVGDSSGDENRVQQLSPGGVDFLVREFGDQYRACQQRTPLAITAVHLLTREMR
jgi:hypothetical protein